MWEKNSEEIPFSVCTKQSDVILHDTNQNHTCTIFVLVSTTAAQKNSNSNQFRTFNFSKTENSYMH